MHSRLIMTSSIEIDRRLIGYSVYESLLAIRDIYAEIDMATATWAIGAGVACPAGCGSCCEAFEPDFLPTEALFLAAWLIGERGETFAIPDAPEGRCPFYGDHGGWRCSVYPARGLVCRLFGFSGARDKGGAIRYNPCKWMPPLGPAARGATPLAMEDFARMAVALDPHGCSRPLPIREALPSALAKIMFILRNGEDCDPEPEPRAA